MKELTYGEKTFFHNLKTFIENYKYVPTIRELGKYVGLSSPATVYFYLKKLEAKGYIKRINNRNIEILGEETWNKK